jgi:hypothetical protein
MWVNIEQTIEEIKQNPMSLDEYLDIYEDYRENHQAPSFDEEFIET